MPLKKRLSLCLCLLACVALLAYSLSEIGQAVRQVTAELTRRPLFLLDAGHGGFDGGAAAADGTVEKDINLRITLRLADLLTLQGYDVILTRQSDVSTDDPTDGIRSKKVSDLKNRLALMRQHPDATFISIHLNKFTTAAATGAQVFYAPQTADRSRRLGDAVQHSIVFFLQPDNTRAIKQSGKSTYLLYNAPIPAILVECGFLSNPKELSLLKNEDYQSRMAFAIFCGILDDVQDGGQADGR